MTKHDELLGHMRAGRWREALRLAASFPRLGAHAAAIRNGWEAAARPDFQRQLGRDPDELVQLGIDALLNRYLPEASATGNTGVS